MLTFDDDLTGADLRVVAQFGDALMGGTERQAVVPREGDPLGLTSRAEDRLQLPPQRLVAVRAA